MEDPITEAISNELSNVKWGAPERSIAEVTSDGVAKGMAVFREQVDAQVEKKRNLPSVKTSAMIAETKVHVEHKVQELELLEASKLVKIGEINDRSAARIARQQQYVDHLRAEHERIQKEIVQFMDAIDKEEIRGEEARRECATFYDREIRIAKETISSMNVMLASLQAIIPNEG